MKRTLAVIGCLLASQTHAVQLSGTVIPQNQFGKDCDPYALNTDFIYSGTWGKRATPRNCATVTVKNPVFFWTKPPATDQDQDPEHAGTTVLRVYSDLKDINNRPVFDESIPTTTPRMIFPFELKPGKYTWEVSYVLNGVPVPSLSRKFYVAETEARLPMPQEVLDSVKNHPRPRAVPIGSSHGKIAEDVLRSELKPAFEATKEDAEAYTKKLHSEDANYNMTPEPTSPGGMSEDAWKTDLYNFAKKERRAIETLAHMYLFTSDIRYLTACRARLLNLAAWAYEDDTAPTGEGYQDQANRDIFLALAIGLDFFASPAVQKTGQGLGEKEYDTVLASLRGRIEQARTSVAEIDKYPYLPHRLTAVHYLTEALMYAQGLPEFKKADDYLLEAWRDLITTVGSFGGAQDGAYGNGSAYGWYTMNVYARTLAAIRLIAGKTIGETVANFAPFGQIGINQIAQTPPSDPTATETKKLMGIFGDGVEDRDLFWDHGGTDFRLLAHATGKPEYEWYWRTFPGFVNRAKRLLPYHFLLLGETIPKAPPADLAIPNSFKFEDAGFVAFHSNAKDPERSSVFFRSSPLGSENHSHADNNSFNFISKGKEILISSGFYQSYGNNHHELWTRHTKAKNALTFDGGIGQAERTDKPGFIFQSTDASGKLVNYYAGNGWRIATGDATDAYRTYDGNTGKWIRLVNAAYRTVAYRPAEGVVIVYDYAASDTARNWELNFHTLYKPTLGSGKMTLFGDASMAVKVCGQIQGPAAAFAIPVDSFEGGTGEEETPFTEWHIRQTTLNKQKEFVAVTILRENCDMTIDPPVISGTSRQVTYTKPAAEKPSFTITFDKKTVTVD